MNLLFVYRVESKNRICFQQCSDWKKSLPTKKRSAAMKTADLVVHKTI
tara:strand:- start:235 stop:378 length:144 start_codon:yes stop_codon:yes gene_type:complete